MLDLQRWSNGKATMEEILNEVGLTGGQLSTFCDVGLKYTKFLLIMNFITEEEAQTITQRIIAYIMRAVMK